MVHHLLVYNLERNLAVARVVNSKFTHAPRTVEQVDLNETKLGSVAVSGNQTQFTFDPYKIITFKLTF